MSDLDAHLALEKVLELHQPGRAVILGALCGRHENHRFFSITSTEAGDVRACPDCAATVYISCAGCGPQVSVDACPTRAAINSARMVATGLGHLDPDADPMARAERADTEGLPVAAKQRARIKPRIEARALAAEWIDTYRRTDDRWRDSYTEDEAAQIDTALDAFVATLPDPSESLFFRLRADNTEG